MEFQVYLVEGGKVFGAVRGAVPETKPSSCTWRTPETLRCHATPYSVCTTGR
jgi:hypothetical protein